MARKPIAISSIPTEALGHKKGSDDAAIPKQGRAYGSHPSPQMIDLEVSKFPNANQGKPIRLWREKNMPKNCFLN